MSRTVGARRDHIRSMLADLKLPGALEAADEILADVDGGALTASEAIEQLLNAQISLRNNRRLQTAMRSSRLPAIKLLEQFDFAFQPSIRREQIESLHELGFIKRKENVIFLDRPASAKRIWRSASRSPPRNMAAASIIAPWSISSSHSSRPGLQASSHADCES